MLRLVLVLQNHKRPSLLYVGRVDNGQSSRIVAWQGVVGMVGEGEWRGGRSGRWWWRGGCCGGHVSAGRACCEVSRASQDEVGLPKIFAEDPRLNPIRQHR